MTKYTDDELLKDMDSAEDVYFNTISRICNKLFNQNVKPFCKQRGWKFYSGMGTYTFTDKKHNHVYQYNRPLDKIFNALIQALESSSNMLNGTPIGSMMPDYDPEEEK